MGHGIELDVQASADAHAFVFHDDALDRLTNARGPIAERTSSELEHIALRDCGETLAALPDILQLIAGRVPLLIEVKAKGGHVAQICLSVMKALAGYRGPVGVMSFNPEVGRWFSAHAPRVTRGLVVSESSARGPRGALQRRLALWRARPDFLAYDVRDLPSRFAARARRRGIPVLAWTVRSAKQAKTARANGDQLIYELPSASA
jgi:glycerophosphoryl diester phosphodiesterase